MTVLKTFIRTTVCAAVCALGAQAQARGYFEGQPGAAPRQAPSVVDTDTGLYANVGLGTINLSNFGETLRTTSLFLRLGYSSSRVFDGEVDLAFSVAPGNLDGDDYVLSTFGIYAKGNLPIGTSTDIFARIGYIGAAIGVDNGGAVTSISSNAIAVGFGGEFSLSERTGVLADATYAGFEAADGSTTDGVESSLALSYRF